ncbi:MAG: anthranilate synthase component 1 [Pseudomonadota bacterium]
MTTFVNTKPKVKSLSVKVDCQHDPLNIFYHLTYQGKKKSTMLLESSEIGSKHAEKSLLVLSSVLRIVCVERQVTLSALNANGVQALKLLKLNLTDDETSSSDEHLTLSYEENDRNQDEEGRLFSRSPVDVLRKIQQVFGKSNEPYSSFLCGLFGYDLIETFETLPEVNTGEADTPNYVFYLAETLLVIDHKRYSARLIGNVFDGENQEACYFDMSRTLADLKRQIESVSEGTVFALPDLNTHTQKQSVAVDVSRSEYKSVVGAMKQEIAKGEVFQIVPSRTFSLPCTHPFLSYRKLKSLNPSPYMFFMNDDNFQLFGASPESAVKYEESSRHVEVYPIAGTRPRGKYHDGQLNLDLDAKIEAELKMDEKEVTEHLMLVDLARNDIARISKPGSRHVPELLNVDRYSHVMHLVSRVRGELRNELDALHAYLACMNMGTLVGAPKIKAAEILRRVEKKRRGAYGGAVGYLDGERNMDTCIVIRSALIKNQMAYIKAGAGIVHDSDPDAEVTETLNKAMAVIKAIAEAHHFDIQIDDEVSV